MEDLKLLSLPDLLDLLIEQTIYHTNLIASGATPEQFRMSNNILRGLQNEIKLRNDDLRDPKNEQNSPSYDSQ
jgi:hypothetical protein